MDAHAPETAQAVQTWFRKRGLSMLLAGTPLAQRTSERAAPALVVCFLLAMASAAWMTSLDLWLSLSIGLAVVVLTWVASNLIRRRPPFAWVKAIGWLEGASFVVAPAAMVAAAAQVGQLDMEGIDPDTEKLLYVISFVVIQVLALLTILGLEKLGVVTLASWLSRTLFATFSQTGSALATSLPVSLGVVFFFFLNPGVWGSIGMLTPTPYLALIGLLLLLAGAFLGSQRHLGLDALTSFATQDEFLEALAETPLAATAKVDTPMTCPMGPLQKFYVRQVAVLSQLVVSVIIALAVFALFVVIGYLAVDPGTAAAWTRTAPRALVKFVGPEHTYVITEAHLRVAGFLAAFVAFNYSLASATDGRLRQNSKETASEAIRQASAMRIALLNSSTRRSE